MGFNDFLRHTCDIYHIRKSDESPGYNLPSSPMFSYPDEPDLKSVPCLFKSGGGTVTRSEPQARYDVRTKLSLPAGTDVRINDKVIDLDTGYEYTAEEPRNIRGHHVTVMVWRTAQQGVL